MNTASETKGRKRTLIIYDALAFLFLAIAAIIFSINHICAIFAIPLLLIGLVFASLALRLTLINFGSTHVFATRWGLGIGIPSVALCGILFWIEIRPQPKPYPHFTFSLLTDDAPYDRTELTNDFLEVKSFEGVSAATGIVILPLRSGKVSSALTFLVKNDSSVLAEDVVAVISFPAELNCTIGQDFSPVVFEKSQPTPDMFSILGIETNILQSWEHDFHSAILSGISEAIPPIIIPQVPPKGCLFSILVRAKDSPAQKIKFTLFPIIVSTTFPPQKPFIIKGDEISSNEMSFQINKIFDTLKK